MSAPLLQIDKLSAEIAGGPILREVSLSVAAGETLALVGESGSGKSFTSLACMGLAPREARLSGAIRLGERALLSLSEREMQSVRGAEIGMVFQEPMTALNPLQRVGAQVAEALRLHQGLGRPHAMERAGAILRRVGLEPRVAPPSRYPHELSGGQRQRVVIAMAIAAEPKLIIADEPTTALDVTAQGEILDLLRGLTADGRGLIFITHDLAVAAEIADRIAVMERGRIVETGSAAAVLRAPQAPYTLGLLAAAQDFGPARSAAPILEDAAPLLSVQKASRVYPGGHTAVDDVSLTIAAGERVGLIGESGSGKSTLMRAILGLEPLQSGRILLGGQDLAAARGAALRALRRKVQVVFQDPAGAFNPRMRVERLVAEPLHLLDAPLTRAARRARVEEALRRVQLAPADADKHPHQFSGGQRQRLAIARALIVEPELILFDEAVTALDVSTRAQILHLLAELSATLNVAYLFISHDLAVVRAITDRALVMRAGRIVEEGATADVMNAPKSDYAKALLAATPSLEAALKKDPVP
ncbi:MAG: dipeptide ABC transporter ATP-binding protein [Pseudomonadota bacterium]